jgi:hypothetical protein
VTPPVEQQPVLPHDAAMEQGQGSRRSAWMLIIGACVIFAGMCFVMAWTSRGFLEADGIFHAMRRRFALTNHAYFVDIWTRPLCVIVYSVPSYLFGLMGTRMTSCVLAIAAALLTWRVAARLEIPRPELAAIFLLGQPMLIMHSASEMTELTFMLLLLGMFWAYLEKQWVILALLTALGPMARPEGFGFLIVVTIGLLMHRKWFHVLIVPLGLVAWSYAGWQFSGQQNDFPWWKWLPKNWPYSAESVYAAGNGLKFLATLPVIAGPFAMPFLIGGAWVMLTRTNWRLIFRDHTTRCVLFVPGLALGILVGHSLLFQFGLMASAGLIRVILIVGPMIAIMSCLGFVMFCDWFSIRKIATWCVAGVLTIVPLHQLYPIYPLALVGDDLLAVKVAERLKTDTQLMQRYTKVMCSLPRVYFEMDADQFQSKLFLPWSLKHVEAAGPETLIIWDEMYAQHNSTRDLVVTAADLERLGWRVLEQIELVEKWGTKRAVFYVRDEKKAPPQ